MKTEAPPDAAAPNSSDAALFDQVATLPRWFSPDALRPVIDVNRRLLSLMQTSPVQLQLPAPLVQQVHSLDEVAVERLAGCPCLLVDVGFLKHRRGELIQRAQLKPLAVSAGRPAPALLTALARMTCWVAWHYARLYPAPAHLVLGMSPAVRHAFNALAIDELDELSAARSHRLRPRWLNNPAMWTALITAIKNQKPAIGAHARVLQLALGDLEDDRLKIS